MTRSVASLFAILIVACGAPPQHGQTPFEPVGLLAFGDTGYDFDNVATRDYAQGPNGRSGLLPVATAMRQYCANTDCAFAVMLGDNIYPSGAAGNSEDTELFRRLFTEPFGTLGAGRQGFAIYPTLGNHDWLTSRAGAAAQIEFLRNHPPFEMGGYFYRVKPRSARGEVELFVIDTEMLLAGTTVYEPRLGADGSELPSDKIVQPSEWAKPSNDAERDMQQWLDEGLRSSTARWKIVLGHHPLWSTNGAKFEQARALRRLILPSLCRYADIYLAGHEHTLEVHTDNCQEALGKPAVVPLLHVVSGAGAKQRRVNHSFVERQARTYPQLRTISAIGNIWGFAHLTLEAKQVVVRLVTTPNDGSGTPYETHVSHYPRRGLTQ